ncbi:toxin co-regulated pilus biosynthesis Q family protein [Burkholderia multivorans]|uniref:toxin co-regulated pilus biosynthesis Q family protein n=1 Tax=Burkholderia multivorans TaxID=87883 RepID=UPI001C211129|nr:toxin co-regulated pilus biosynthesis Q family protein [Burkholderia multivorans]MBU9651044.1 toxin co-regulated pilus biosynthesis Q family protein [Burkholderia multivorans]
MSAASRSVAIAVGVLSFAAAVGAADGAAQGTSAIVHIAPYRPAAPAPAAAAAAAAATASETAAQAALEIAGAPADLVPEAVVLPATPLTTQATFALVAGQSIQTQLQSWAARAGWTVVWDVQQDWIVPNSATFPGGFESAAQQVIEALAANGADVRADLYTGNKSMVVHQAGNE